jgi:hypothetical protein
VQLLRGLAVGSVMGLVRDLVVRTVPPNYTSEASRWVDELTTALASISTGAATAPETTRSVPEPSSSTRVVALDR